MIPVDLNRLREALSSSSGTLADLELAESTVAAVLAAPTVWWCEVRWMAKDHEDDLCVAEAGHPGRGCGWVVLVPVEGGQE